MACIYTDDCPNGFKKVTLDDNSDVEIKIEELRVAIQEFKQELDDEEIEKHLKLMVKEGLVDENFAPLGFPKGYSGR